MRLIWIIFYLLLVLAGVSFAALNASTVSINLYVTKLTMPVSVLMIIMLGIGVFIGLFLFFCRYWRLKKECLVIKNQLKTTEKEMDSLRGILVKDQHCTFHD